MIPSVVGAIVFSVVALARAKAQAALDRIVDNLRDNLFDQVLNARPFRIERPRFMTGTVFGDSTLPTALPDAIASIGIASTRKWSPPNRKKLARFPRPVRRSALGTRSPGVDTSKAKNKRQEFEDRSMASRMVIWKLAQGNLRYVETARSATDGAQTKVGKPADSQAEDKNGKEQLEALVIMCPTVFVRASDIFQLDDRHLIAVEAAGCVCQPYDGIVGSIEFIVQQKSPPVVLVMGNSLSYPIRAAVRRAVLQNNPDTPFPTETSYLEGFPESESLLTDILLPAAVDAVAQQPHGSVRRLCEIANKLNVFNTIETVLRSSKIVRDKIKTGSLQVHGAFLDQRTGKVLFMGEHPLNEQILQGTLDADVRDAGAKAVPPDEAFARLWAGNQRFRSDHVARSEEEEEEPLGLSRMQDLATQGQHPLAVLLGCSDSRAPTEAIFDAQPGDIFAIRNAGNICENNTVSNVGCSTTGSAEYAIQVLGTQLFVVMGHTNCGAVIAAVKRASDEKNSVAENTPAGDSQKGDLGTIGNMLVTMRPQATAAVYLKDTWEEQVQLAATLNVYATIEKMLTASPIIRGAVARRELEIYGAMYNITTGAVKWLGAHRNLETLVAKSLPIHRWKESPFVSGQFTIDHFGGFLGPNGTTIFRAERRDDQAVWSEAVKELKRGNERFLRGTQVNKQRQSFVYDKTDPKPYAMVLTGAERAVSIRAIFDAAPRDMLVQRTVGNLAGGARGTLFASLEYSIIRFAPKVILVLGESDSDVVKTALKYALGDLPDEFPKSLKRIISRVAVNGVRALRNVELVPQETSAGTKAKVLRLAVELNALYYIEKMLTMSEVIRSAVIRGQLEIHAAVLNEEGGEVDFLGPHPMQEEILRECGS